MKRPRSTACLTATSWPRHLTTSVQTRKRDVVIRVADWTRDRHEPAYDVECYVAGVYDWRKSKTFCTRSAKRTKKTARVLAVAFAQKQIARLLL